MECTCRLHVQETWHGMHMYISCAGDLAWSAHVDYMCGRPGMECTCRLHVRETWHGVHM